jgi:hypothetical protein
MKSELYQDITVANSLSGQNKHGTGGLSMNHRIHFVNQFMDILDPTNSYKDNSDSAQLEGALRVIGQHKALTEGDMTLYQALKNNQLKEIQILEYLNSDEKVSGTSSSNLSKYMSESVRSEISEF